jgi:hypothetical protein
MGAPARVEKGHGDPLQYPTGREAGGLELGDLTKTGAPPNKRSYMPLAPNWFVRWLPWVKKSYETRCQQGEQAYLRALDGFQKTEQERLQAIESKKYELETKVRALSMANS